MGLNKSSSSPYLPFVVWETFSNSTKMGYSLGYGDQWFRTCDLRTWASIGMNVQSSVCCSLRNLKGGSSLVLEAGKGEAGGNVLSDPPEACPVGRGSCPCCPP